MAAGRFVFNGLALDPDNRQPGRRGELVKLSSPSLDALAQPFETRVAGTVVVLERFLRPD